MQRVIFTYGIISGFLVIGSVMLTLRLSGGQHPSGTVWLGYLVMLMVLSLIFVAIKRYRDRELGGVIRFGTATLVGLGIAAVAGAVYVAVWEVYLALTDHAFIRDYTDALIAARQAEGVAGEELAQLLRDMDELKQQYANPLFRLPMTFLEIFPVGLIITLVSAAILRNGKVLPDTA